jgi:AcrR family transcriptional regulator
VNSRGAELKQERALRTRQQILEAAAQAFAERGYPAVTILDVAELAGLTKGAVYFHFANKEALATAVSEGFYAHWPRLAQEVAESGLPPLARLRELLLRTAADFQQDMVVQAGARLQIERALVGPDLLPAPFTTYRTLLGELLTQAQEQGELRPDADPAALCDVLESAMFGAQHISWVQTGRADLVERTRHIIAAVVDPARAVEG